MYSEVKDFRTTVVSIGDVVAIKPKIIPRGLAFFFFRSPKKVWALPLVEDLEAIFGSLQAILEAIHKPKRSQGNSNHLGFLANPR
jgi:hypothetical protein